ncbi:MAG: hypothetical protein LBD74_04310 [Spirochaetaceae bacterium]|jgi:hypothetical protein|nr:hypothetical protein [Spirochaetaceae bacterium]
MKNLRWLALSWLVVLIPGIYSQTEEPGGRITALDISGLKRTKLHVAERPLRQFLGIDAADIDIDAVYAVLMDTGILEPLNVDIRDTGDGRGKILMVEVREKWSVFPLPVVFVGSGGTSFGGFFVDTNAFGLNDKFFIGGMYGSAGWMTLGVYVHTPVREGFPGWTMSGSFARSEQRHTDQRDEDLRRFDLDRISGSAGLTYTFTEVFKGAVDLSYTQALLQETDGGERHIGIAAELALRKARWDGFLLSEESLSGSYKVMAGLDSPFFQVLRFRGVYEKSLLPGFRVRLHTGALYAPGVTVLSESSPSVAQVAILPQSFSARHYAGASLGLEKYLFKMAWGVLSGGVSYQGVYSYGSILGNQFDHGLAGTLSFYLSKLAIPALGIGIAYNVYADYLQGSFSLGVSF